MAKSEQVSTDSVTDLESTQEANVDTGSDDGHQSVSRSLKIRLIVFCSLLILAMFGMGLTEAREDGGWEYWIFLLLVYGLVSVAGTWQKARREGEPLWQMIRKQVLHWLGALISLKILFLLENTDIISREAVSDVSLIVLALVCYLAGVHFQWEFLLIGIFVGVMAISLAYVEQFSVWLIMIPAAVAVVWIYLRHYMKRST